MSQTGMKQRCWEHDYCAPSFYMITVVTEPRRPCLSGLRPGAGVAPGTVPKAGAAPGTGPKAEAVPGTGPRAVPDTANEELLKLSPMGEVVQEVWRRTSEIYSGVEACECVAMPDHFHGILWVKEQQPRHMGHIVKAFKRVAEQECRSAGLLMPPSRVPAAAHGSVPAAAHGSVPAIAPTAGPCTIWEEGYQDTILLRRGQLKAMVNYIADNPRRLAIKRANPELFTVVYNQPVADDLSCQAIGNRFLLDHPVKRQVQVSRRISAETLAEKKEELLYAAEHGAVLVSPCISPGEKEIARAALDAGKPLIVLLANGIAPYYKPPGRYFDACANGHLLMLAPFPHQSRKRPITREECLTLNRLARSVVD